jgi:hypothetical protein
MPNRHQPKRFPLLKSRGRQLRRSRLYPVLNPMQRRRLYQYRMERQPLW